MKLNTKESKGYALFLAILPVIMMYKVPVIGMGASTVLIALGMVYAILVLFFRRERTQWSHMIVFIFYFLYVMVKSTSSNIMLCIAILIHFTALSIDTADYKYLRTVIENISVVAAICVIVQFVVHSATGSHIQLINLNLCLQEMDQYTSNITTGISRHEAMYRPSAFFLEPSHLAIYASIGLVSCLLMGEPKYKKAILISLGVICTTSGIGTVLVTAIWAAFPFLATKGVNNKKLKRIILLVSFGLIAIVILYQMPFFQAAMNRITGTASYSSTQYNAIWGRTLYWSSYIAPMKGTELLFGYGYANMPEVYFTGLMTILYCYGILGCVLLYTALVMLFFTSNNPGCRILVGIYGVLLPFANLTSFITMIFYIGSIIALHKYSKEDFDEDLYEGYC